MKITLEVPDDRAGFLLELLRSLLFVKLRSHGSQKPVLDATAHLPSSPANAKRLYAALARAQRHEQQSNEV